MIAQQFDGLRGAGCAWMWRRNRCRRGFGRGDACSKSGYVRPQIARMIGWWPSKFLAMLVGVLYPSIESYKALKTESKDDDSQVGAIESAPSV
jgi:hypothetical protein